jgi:hypothetical protein
MGRSRGQAEQEPEWKAAALASRHEKRPINTGVYLTEDSSKKLKTAALVEALDQSAIVNGLIQSGLKGYYSGRRERETGEDAQVA